MILFPIPIPMPSFILGILWVYSDVSGSIRVRFRPCIGAVHLLQACSIVVLLSQHEPENGGNIGSTGKVGKTPHLCVETRLPCNKADHRACTTTSRTSA